METDRTILPRIYKNLATNGENSRGRSGKWRCRHWFGQQRREWLRGSNRLPLWSSIRVRFHIIRNYQIENVRKSQSCMVSKLRTIRKQTVRRRTRLCLPSRRCKTSPAPPPLLLPLLLRRHRRRTVPRIVPRVKLRTAALPGQLVAGRVRAVANYTGACVDNPTCAHSLCR